MALQVFFEEDVRNRLLGLVAMCTSLEQLEMLNTVHRSFFGKDLPLFALTTARRRLGAGNIQTIEQGEWTDG